MASCRRTRAALTSSSSVGTHVDLAGVERGLEPRHQRVASGRRPARGLRAGALSPMQAGQTGYTLQGRAQRRPGCRWRPARRPAGGRGGAGPQRPQLRQSVGKGGFHLGACRGPAARRLRQDGDDATHVKKGSGAAAPRGRLRLRGRCAGPKHPIRWAAALGARLLGRRLDHDPDEGFGAARAQQDPALFAQGPLRPPATSSHTAAASARPSRSATATLRSTWGSAAGRRRPCGPTVRPGGERGRPAAARTGRRRRWWPTTRKTMWPDCSPPSAQPLASRASST